MNIYMNLIGNNSRKAYENKINSKTKNKVLNDYAKLIAKEKKFIIGQNLKDLKFAKTKGLKEFRSQGFACSQERYGKLFIEMKGKING